jgi:DNA modification methylase
VSTRILIGDCRAILPTLPEKSVHCCVTSPPYFGLRDYGVAGQIGLEASVDEYVAELVAVFREVGRVLRDDGTLWLNLGDSYARSGGEQGGGNRALMHLDGVQRRMTTLAATEGIKAKDLIGVPWMVAFALRADGWYLRSDIVWSKPNPMPESVTDRPTRAHEYVFLLTKQPRYYFDADAVREANSSPEQLAHNLKYAKPYEVYDERAGETGQPGNVNNVGIHSRPGKRVKIPGGWDLGPGAHGTVHRDGRTETTYQDAEVKAGRNIRSVWTIATHPFPEAHFATFPPALVEPCVKAGCPLGGTVLDPFGGAGTAGLVADRLGRDGVLIELNPAYAEIARRRIVGDAPMLADVTVV